jgi:predicted AAA+ superfamily ATPase
LSLNLFYWHQGNHEVDFVLEYKGKVIGLEIKSGRSWQASGMSAFYKQYNPYKVLLVGNSGIAWQEFLEINPLELFD